MAYFKRGALVQRFTLITTTGGTTNLTASSNTHIIFQGGNPHTVVLPDATTCDGGSNNTGSTRFYISNRSSGIVRVMDNAGTLQAALQQGADCVLSCTNDTTAAGVWHRFFFDPKDQPLKLSQNSGTDANIRISGSQMPNMDGTGARPPPISSVIPTVSTSTHNLQTGATTGNTFAGATIPTTTVGQFRRVGYTLLANGTIQVIWSAAAASLGALSNPGAVFVKTGLPIGWADVEATDTNAFKTAGSATSIVENNVGGVARIFRFGSGGGGGGGSGDASQFLIELEDRLGSSFFNCMTPNIFSVDGDTKVAGGSTGSYDIANSAYLMASVGQFLLSTQSYDTSFLENTADSVQIELHTQWLVVDEAATYEVSRDGGLNWDAVDMSRVGASGKYRGIATFAEPGIYTELAGYDVAEEDATQAFNATTAQQYAIPFTITSAKWRTSEIVAEIFKQGSPTGNFWAQIVKDDGGGAPSTSTADIMVESTFQSIGSMSAGDNTITFPVIQPLPAGTYWIVYKTDAAYKASYSAGVTEIRFRSDATSPTYGADSYSFDGTTWSVLGGVAGVFSLQGIPYDLRVRITSGTAAVSLSGYGIFYEEDSLAMPSGQDEYQAFEVNGSDNTTSFAVTNFNVNPRALIVYDTENDTVYRFPKFTVNGNTVTFPNGTFFVPGKIFRLHFEQFPARSGMNTDKLAAVLASNGLGSSDVNFDFSSPGAGLKLRSPDGTKILVRVLNNGALDTVVNGW